MGAAVIRAAMFVGLLGLSGAQADPSQAMPEEKVIRVVYLGKAYPEPLPISLVETVPTDRGVQGARLLC